MRILMVAPDEFGFRQYTNDLTRAMRSDGISQFEVLPPFFFKDLAHQSSHLIERIRNELPSLIHFQHEFGTMGSKVPFRYQFPRFVKVVRKNYPKTKLIATAHTVIPPDFKYPVKGRGIQAPIRWIVNQTALPGLKKLWGQRTWGKLDGVIVHSSQQLSWVRSTGCKEVVEIPHYVPPSEETTKGLSDSFKKSLPLFPVSDPWVFVFGYLTPEKGQDIAIEAFSYLKTRAILVLAGGLRRPQDQKFYNRCEKLIDQHQLRNRVFITGFVEWQDLDFLVSKGSLGLIPFRETSGSGSLADLISRRTPIIASQIPLNQEISERVPGTLRYFKSGDPKDLAKVIDAVLADAKAIPQLRKMTDQYAQLFSAPQMARRHIEFYQKLLEGRYFG